MAAPATLVAVNAMIDLHIVIVHYRGTEDTLHCLETLMPDIAAGRFAVRVTVVDNSGNCDQISAHIAKRFPAVQYIDAGGNLGLGRAATIGFKSEDARYYMALNPDIEIMSRSRTCDRIIEFMDAHPRVGCMGPKLEYFDGSLQHSCFRFDLSSILIKPLRQIRLDERYPRLRRYIDRLHMRDFDHHKTQPVDWVLGAAMVVRREVTETVGWFDPRYFMYLEDADWCRSMWEHGWPVYYVHDIVIRHHYARDSAKVPGILNAMLKNRMARAHLRSWTQFLWKWRKSFKHYLP